MKRLISVICITILLLNTITVFAGDAPGIFMNEKAAVFFGEVAAYDEMAKTITVIPTQKIKGDVEIGIEQTFEYDYPYADYASVGGAYPVPNKFEEYLLEEGAVFIMGYGGYGSGEGVQYTVEPPFDPQMYVFKSTSTDIKTLELETAPYFSSSEHEIVGAWVEHYLNNGAYERAEIKRLENNVLRQSLLEQIVVLQNSLKQTLSQQSSVNNNYFYIYGIIGVVILVAVFFIIKKKR